MLFSIIIAASLATVNLIMAAPIEYKPEPHELVEIPVTVGTKLSGIFVAQFETASTALAESRPLDVLSDKRLKGITSIHSGSTTTSTPGLPFPHNCVLHAVRPKLSKPQTLKPKLMSATALNSGSNGWNLDWTKDKPYHKFKMRRGPYTRRLGIVTEDLGSEIYNLFSSVPPHNTKNPGHPSALEFHYQLLSIRKSAKHTLAGLGCIWSYLGGTSPDQPRPPPTDLKWIQNSAMGHGDPLAVDCYGMNWLCPTSKIYNLFSPKSLCPYPRIVLKVLTMKQDTNMRITFSVVLITAFLANVILPVMAGGGGSSSATNMAGGGGGPSSSKGGGDGGKEPPPPYSGPNPSSNFEQQVPSKSGRLVSSMIDLIPSRMRSLFRPSSSSKTSVPPPPPKTNRQYQDIEVHIVPLDSGKKILQGSNTAGLIASISHDPDTPYEQTRKISIDKDVHYLRFVKSLPESCLLILFPRQSSSTSESKKLTIRGAGPEPQKRGRIGGDWIVPGRTYSAYKVECFWK
ncbi:hypothetical protein F5880DRAFT_1509027 [Lentinula raphanica]|nr:hypothetical protein F5880DRAFT_1509027 [Lentinula raphanica]